MPYLVENKPRTNRSYFPFFTCLIIVLLLSACRKKVIEEPIFPPNPTNSNNCTYTIEEACADTSLQKSHLLLGNPSNAVPELSSPNNYLISLPQYKLSYSRDRGIPNWVAWHLDTEWLGDAPRQNNFRGYWDLPLDWFFVQTSDYSNTGFNRGHNCPSADRKCSENFNSETFYMINVIPQSPKHNQGPWADLENYARSLVASGKELYIIMGNYGTGGVGEKGYATSIAGGAITVPQSIWKVIIVLDKGEDDLNRVNTQTRIIAVDIENDENVGDIDWGIFRVSVDYIEAQTGLDLLSSLHTSLQEELEGKIDEGETF